MRKLVSVFILLVLFVVVLPSCSGNDYFTEVTQGIDENQSNTETTGTDEKEKVGERPGND